MSADTTVRRAPAVGARSFRGVFAGAARVSFRAWRYWAPPVVIVLILAQFFSLSINVTESLPQRAFLILKFDSAVQRGDYVAFLHPGGGPYPHDAPFVKIAVGVAGDVVTNVDGIFYVNGASVGKAKPYSRSGMPLMPGPTGVIPAGFYYVQTPHPDSFDSRYAATGWIHQTRIIGRAIALF